MFRKLFRLRQLYLCADIVWVLYSFGNVMYFICTEESCWKHLILAVQISPDFYRLRKHSSDPVHKFGHISVPYILYSKNFFSIIQSLKDFALFVHCTTIVVLKVNNCSYYLSFYVAGYYGKTFDFLTISFPHTIRVDDYNFSSFKDLLNILFLTDGQPKFRFCLQRQKLNIKGNDFFGISQLFSVFALQSRWPNCFSKFVLLQHTFSKQIKYYRSWSFIKIYQLVRKQWIQ